MDAPLTSDAVIRPWRTATLVASLVAALELVVLIVLLILLLAKPLAHAVRKHAETASLTAPKHHLPVAKREVVGLPRLMREQTGVLVLNGNGRSGAAASEASKLRGLGYRIRSTGNASRQDFATTVIMFRRGYHAEGLRLARDLHVHVVGALDGMKTSALHGAQLVVVLGVR